VDTRQYSDELVDRAKEGENAQRLALSMSCKHHAGKTVEGNALRCVSCRRIVGFVRKPG